MPRRKTEEEVPEVETDEQELLRIRSVNKERVEARIKEYENDFEADSLTVIDRSQIRYLARLELASEDATNALMDAVNLTAAQRKALSDAAKSLIAETRQLTDSLGMSRKSRMSDSDSEMSEYLPKLHREAQDFLRQRAIAIICPHCRKEQAEVTIMQGAIIFHFAFETEWIWRSKCPRCGKKFEINASNYTDFLFDKPPKKTTAVEDDYVLTDEESQEEESD